MMMMMMMIGDHDDEDDVVERCKEGANINDNEGRSGRSKYLPTVADNDENDTDFVANCHKLSTNFCQRKWTILMRIY